jgi:hypothetical protein
MIGQDKKDKQMDFPGILERKGGGEGGGEEEMGKGEKRKDERKVVHEG